MRELLAAFFSSCVLKMLFRDAFLFNSIVRDNQNFEKKASNVVFRLTLKSFPSIEGVNLIYTDLGG